MRDEPGGRGRPRTARRRRRARGGGRLPPVAAPLVAAAVALAAAAAPRPATAQDDGPDVPYVPTPMPVVEQMLELVRPAPGDSVYDLGSGDGRIVIAAAEEYGTPGIGVEIDSARVATARSNARDSGVEDLVRFVRGDLFETDVGPATVVTLYLLSSVNRELRPKLFRELRPGTRVVSHDFDMGEWAADSVIDMPDQNSTVYYWVMPARVHGRWTLRLPGGASATVEIDQKFQELRATAPEGGVRVSDARVRGESVHFTLTGVEGATGGTLELSGTASDGRMSGATAGGARWSAERTAGADWPIDAWRSPAPRR